MNDSTRLVKTVEKGLGALAIASYRRPGRALSIALGFTLLLGAFATRLNLVADLTELLPETFPSVQDLEIVKERFGGIGFVIVVAQNGDPDAMRRFADDLAPQLEALDTVRWVEYRRPASFFEDHLLYFLDLEDLEVVHQRLEARYEWERAQRNPLLLDLEQADPPSLDFSDIQSSQEGKADQQWMLSQLGEQYYIDPEKRIIALLAKPSSPAMKLDIAKTVFEQVKAITEGMDLSQYDADISIGYTGRYVRAVDQQALITKDLRASSLLALLTILVLLFFLFRRGVAVLFVMVPLVVGLIWTYGLAQIIFGNLNILTGFIGAILLGLGIDHGIHLLGRYEHEKSLGSSPDEVIQATFGNTGRAVTIAAITTTVGFAGLGLSEFRAFNEFGVISAVGMVMVVVAYVTVLPSLIGVATRLHWKPHEVDVTNRSIWATRLPQWAGRTLIVSVVVILGVGTQLPKATFNYDFRALEAHDLPSFILDKEVNLLLGYSQSPVIVLTDTVEEERVVAAALRERQKERGDQTTIDFVLATTDLIPSHQEEKQAIVEKLDTVVRKVKSSWLEPDLRRHLRFAKRSTKAKPFTRDGLPTEVRRQFQGIEEEADRGFVLIFPAISLTVGSEVSRFAKEVRGVPLPDGRVVSAAGEVMILADIFNMVTREAPPVLSLTLILIFLSMWVLIGGFRLALLCLAPAIITLLATFGLMPLMGLELNYLNIVMIPVLFGIGVDGGAHIVTRYTSGQPLANVVGETGRAVSGAILTTGLGFGALLIAHHPGLESLGQLALLGLAVNALAALVVLPAVIQWWSQRRNDG